MTDDIDALKEMIDMMNKSLDRTNNILSILEESSPKVRRFMDEMAAASECPTVDFQSVWNRQIKAKEEKLETLTKLDEQLCNLILKKHNT